MKLLILSIFALLALIYVGCSKTPKENPRLKDSRIVLQVGDEKLTLGNIEKKFDGVQFRAPQDEFERKKGFVEQMFDRFLLEEGAKQAGLTAEVDSSLYKRYLMQELYNFEIVDKVNVTEKDARRFFEKYGGQYDASHILVPDSSLAESLYTSIRAGSNFEDIARRFSKDLVTAADGGKLGPATRGKFDDKIEDAVFEMKPGEFSRPIHTFYGWHIVKSNGRSQNTDTDYENNKSKYLDAVRMSNIRNRNIEFMDNAKSKYRYKVIQSTLDLVISKAESAKSAEISRGKLPSAAYLKPELFAESELQLPIAKYDGGEINLKSFIEQLQQFQGATSADLKFPGSVDRILQRLVMPPILEKCAIDEGMDKHESFVALIKNSIGAQLAQKMREKLIGELSDITDSEMDKYFNEHRKDFILQGQAKAFAIALKTQAEADDILRKLKDGAIPTVLAKKYSVDPSTNTKGGDLGYFSYQQFPEIFTECQKMKKGDIGGPVVMRGIFWVFKMTDYIPEKPKTLDLARPEVINRIKIQRYNDAPGKWLEARKAEKKYTMDLDLIKNNLITTSTPDSSKINK